MTSKKTKKKGPPPQRLKIKGSWDDAVKKALDKPRPKDGWPKETQTKRVKDST